MPRIKFHEKGRWADQPHLPQVVVERPGQVLDVSDYVARLVLDRSDPRGELLEGEAGDFVGEELDLSGGKLSAEELEAEQRRKFEAEEAQRAAAGDESPGEGDDGDEAGGSGEGQAPDQPRETKQERRNRLRRENRAKKASTAKG